MIKESIVHTFIPLGTPPTPKNLRKGLVISIIIVILGGLICILLSRHPLLFMILFIFFGLTVVILKLTGQYILKVEINISDKLMYVSYITMNGQQSVKTIDLLKAKHRYYLQLSKAGPYNVLSIKTKEAKVSLKENTWLSSKSGLNSFKKSELDEMNQLILQIRRQ